MLYMSWSSYARYTLTMHPSLSAHHIHRNALPSQQQSILAPFDLRISFSIAHSLWHMCSRHLLPLTWCNECRLSCTPYMDKSQSSPHSLHLICCILVSRSFVLTSTLTLDDYLRRWRCDSMEVGNGACNFKLQSSKLTLNSYFWDDYISYFTSYVSLTLL